MLPWGQMSLWGATVITSLASAIPVFGNIIVSYLWGGFLKILEALNYGNVIIKTLIDAGTSCLTGEATGTAPCKKKNTFFFCHGAVPFVFFHIRFAYMERKVSLFLIVLKKKALLFSLKASLFFLTKLKKDRGRLCFNRRSAFCRQGLYIYFMSLLFYDKIFLHLITLLQNKVKMMYTIAQSAELVKNKYKTIFIKDNWKGRAKLCLFPKGSPPLVFFFTKLKKKGRLFLKEKSKKLLLFFPSLINFRFYNVNTNSQRLHSKDLMWFVGFVEADGSFSVNKNGKYAKYEFSIELSKRDTQLLYKIKSMLGIGSITFCIQGKSQMARFKISSKTDLISIVIPIFDKYNMLTNKHFDFIHFKSCLLNNIIYYEDVPLYTRPKNPFLKVEEILKLLYFDCWLIGFIEAESSFSTYNERQCYETSSFEISQSNQLEILLAIKKRLNINANPFLYESNYKLKTTSIRGIQNVINFLKQTPAKLKGYKRAQYLKWLHSIRANPKYESVNVPFKY